jgi:hypothetical protein
MSDFPQRRGFAAADIHDAGKAVSLCHREDRLGQIVDVEQVAPLLAAAD